MLSSHPSATRIARLDGIRGIAVLLVFFYHQNLFLRVTWVGVDLFFVLSGYLITRILRETRSDTFYWRRFYVKRFARLAPALLIVLIVAIFFATRFTWLGFLGYAFFLGDVVTATRLHIPALGPLWSLAVEEHFYLVWPWLIRKLDRRTLIGIALIAVLAEPLLRLVARRYVGAAPIYFLTPFRLDAIALGSLLGLVSERPEALQRLGKISLFAAPFSVAAYLLASRYLQAFDRTTNSVLFNGVGYSLVAIMCFFIVAWAVTMRSGHILDRLLSFRPLAYIGLISYGLYLFQEQIIFAIRDHTHVPHAAAIWLSLVLTLGAAAVSFQLFERGVLRWGSRVVRKLSDDTPVSDQAIVGAAGSNAA